MNGRALSAASVQMPTNFKTGHAMYVLKASPTAALVRVRVNPKVELAQEGTPI
jgi:hypothetical protein